MNQEEVKQTENKTVKGTKGGSKKRKRKKTTNASGQKVVLASSKPKHAKTATDNDTTRLKAKNSSNTTGSSKNPKDNSSFEKAEVKKPATEKEETLIQPEAEEETKEVSEVKEEEQKETLHETETKDAENDSSVLGESESPELEKEDPVDLKTPKDSEEEPLEVDVDKDKKEEKEPEDSEEEVLDSKDDGEPSKEEASKEITPVKEEIKPDSKETENPGTITETAPIIPLKKESEPAGFKEEKPKKKKMGKVKKFFLIFFCVLLVAIIGAGCAGLWYYNELLEGCPELDLSKEDNYSVASKIYDASGNLVAEYGENENVEWVSLDEVPQTLIDAFISIEDKRFYEHNGIDIKRLTGAVWGQLTHTSSYGGSTITQQLIKNTHLSSEKTYKRKAQEIHLALQLEKVMSKDEILEWYLNTLYLGQSNVGIKVAAEDYFNKDLDELTVRECAVLAGLAQAPSTYDPRMNQKNGTMEVNDERTNTVLYAMYTNGKLSEEEYEKALNEKTTVVPVSTRFSLYDYPTYVEYAVENVATKLIEEDGDEVNDTTLAEKKAFLRAAGYNIYTAFDTDIQDTMQDAITNFDNYPYTRTEEEAEASAVIIDQHNGRVVAMVGGREEPTEPEGFNRATDSRQAVGSSIKPLSVYAPACDTGDYPGSTVLDVPSSIIGYGEDDSYPNGDYTGSAITMRRALELSHNIPAARFLLEKVTIETSYEYMRNNGFSEDSLVKTAAGLALGATDCTTLEMTAAYATLANLGVYNEPHAFTEVTDRFGNTVLDESCIDTHRVFKESTAWLVTDMLSSNMTEGLGVKARLSNVKSCGKTGTHEHQVISFGGYTHYYTSFLRISCDSYETFVNSSSYYQSSVLWKNYMDPIHEGLDAEADILDKTAEDLDIKQYKVCTNSGKLANDWCESQMEYAALNNAPTEYCDGHIYGEYDETTADWNAETGDPYSQGYWDNSGNWIGQGWWDASGYHAN